MIIHDLSFVTVGVSNRNKGLDCINIFGFHLCYTRVCSQQGEPCKSLYKCIPLQLQVEYAGDPDGTPDIARDIRDIRDIGDT